MAGTSWPALSAGKKAKASEVEAKFDWVEGSLAPMSGGNMTDAVYDLGTSTARWDNLYLAGQARLPDGTSAAPSICRSADLTNGLAWTGSSLGFYGNGRAWWLCYVDGGTGMPKFEVGDTLPSGNNLFYTSVKYAGSGLGFNNLGEPVISSSNTACVFINNLAVYPEDSNTSLGAGAVHYWNEIDYKTLVDRGCLAFMDEGVELQGGTLASDLQAIKKIGKHPTKKTVYGLPMLDYKTFPKVSYKKAAVPVKDAVTGKPQRGPNRQYLMADLPRDENDQPYYIDENGERHNASDGVEMTSVFSLMIGAIKELSARLDALEARPL